MLAGITGFAASFLGTSVLGLSRPVFVLAWTVAGLAFSWLFVRNRGIDPGIQVRRRWPAGILGGLVVGAMLVSSVLRQPGSPGPERADLGASLAWLGVIYGTVDALVLSVVPVLAIYGSRGADTLRQPTSRWRWGLSALAASLLITGLYHFGFAEFRSARLIQPLVGNGIVTASYLMTGNPLAPVVSHVIMHGAAVLHGMDTSAQLPPHY